MKNIFAALISVGLLVPNLLLAALPADLRFQYDRDGGLYPERTHIDLSIKGGVYQHFYNGVEQKVNFSVSQKEMNSLYNTFRWYFFNSIKIKTQEAYDRGGDSVTLVIGASTVTKSNTGQSFINGALSRWRYNQIAGSINSFVQKKLPAQRKPLMLEVETHLTDYKVRLAINGGQITNWENVKLLPGTNELSVALYDDTDLWIKGESFVIEIPEVKIARVQIRDRYISLSTE